jgi:uncharacterized membrane protein
MTKPNLRAIADTLRKSKIERHHIVYAAVMVMLLLVSSVSLISLSPYKTHESSYQYFRARVISERVSSTPDTGTEQAVRVRLLDGPQKNHLIDITRVNNFGDAAAKRLPIGSEVLLSKDSKNGNQYGFIARWYMPGIATLFIILLILVVVIGAWRGITSVFGLAISVAILTVFVVPRIVNGHNAFLTCIEGAILITFVSLYIAHGFTKRTTVAFAASLITLLGIVGLTAFASYVTGTSEIIDEANIGLLYAKHPIDLAGLLTGGVVIASLGVLFDITTGQAATIDEIHEANRKLPMSRLFWKGISVGREHVAALINTLALVYVGVALPAIVTTIVLNQQANYHAPLLVNLNTEIVAEEVLRTCVASIAMLLAMPLTTWLAAYILPRWTPAVDKKIKHWLHNL